jgi:hypothetical protein
MAWTDGADLASGPDGLDALHQGLLGDAEELPRGLIHLADGEGGGTVAVHALEEDGDVAVDDVPGLEGRSSGIPCTTTSLTLVHMLFWKPW